MECAHRATSSPTGDLVSGSGRGDCLEQGRSGEVWSVIQQTITGCPAPVTFSIQEGVLGVEATLSKLGQR